MRCIDEALHKLTELKQLLKKSTPIQSNIPLEQQEIKNVPKPNKLLHLSLRKKKDQFSGRHGEKAERFKAAKNMKIAASPNAFVEKVDKIWEKLNLPKEPIVISDTETDENKVLEQHPVKILPNDELELIKNNQMLTDTSINLARDILGIQFKMKDRFQDTILNQKLMFKPKDQFVQILHNKRFYWVIVSNVNSKSGSVDYCDSLFHGRIKDHAKLQIANISKTENSELEIHIHSYQQQKNGVDCGIFATANAYYILSGIDVPSIRIGENKMRAHFLQCLEQGCFQPFPEKQTDVDTFFSPESVFSVEILCRCRMPWVWYHIKISDLSMAD